MNANDIKAMRQRLTDATGLQALDALYVEWIGYSIVEDDPKADELSVRETLAGYLVELAYAEGVQAAELFGSAA